MGQKDVKMQHLVSFTSAVQKGHTAHMWHVTLSSDGKKPPEFPKQTAQNHFLVSWWQHHSFNIYFPGQLGSASIRMSSFWILLKLSMMEGCVTTADVRCAKLQLNCHHQQTNTQLFIGQMPFLNSFKITLHKNSFLVHAVCVETKSHAEILTEKPVVLVFLVLSEGYHQH